MKQIKLLFLLFLMLLPMVANADYSGNCGYNVYYTYNEATKTLVISGTGSIRSYYNNDTPWNKDMTNIQTIIIENGVTAIGESNFFRCSGLTSVTIPNSVTSIGEWAFSDCYGLTSVHIEDLDAWCKISFTGSGSNPLYYAHHLFLNNDEIKDLIIPNSVTSVGNKAFSGCSGLTSVTMPNSVTSIGTSAFENCCGLTSVTMPNSLKSIGTNAFYGCRGLTSVTIPNSVTSIGAYAFNGCI